MSREGENGEKGTVDAWCVLRGARCAAMLEFLVVKRLTERLRALFSRAGSEGNG
jgi:hypothetical protein